MEIKSFIITGPTASGKSDFADALARRTGGIVINCDSVQIYRGIENISASPLATTPQLADSRQQIANKEIVNGTLPISNSATANCSLLTANCYKLFSILPLTQQISVAEYLELARAEYNAAINAGRPAIFVGGTGFYIKALLNGISSLPEISQDSRNRARDMVRDYPNAAKKLLTESDPGFDKFDPQRMARALEVFLETGRPLSEWQALPRIGALCPPQRGGAVASATEGGCFTKILINPHRDILAQRIAQRVPIMIANGALDETRAAIAAGWDLKRAIGAGDAASFIRGEITEKQMLENWITRTNQYAKRQRTWFRTQLSWDVEIPRIPTDADLDEALKK
jgi:tRNA dimethylallyltransferase